MGKYKMVGFPEPGARRPKVPIFSVKGTVGISVHVTSESVVGVYVHWSIEDKRPWLCQGDECRLCHVGSSVRYRGYLSAICMPYRTHQLVELTEDAAASLGCQIASTETACNVPQSLRGRTLKLFRVSDRPQAKMCCHLERQIHRATGLPPGLDVPALLVRLYEGKGRIT